VVADGDMKRPRGVPRLQPGVEVVPAIHGFVPSGTPALLPGPEFALG
jgi:hypothetical protein